MTNERERRERRKEKGAKGKNEVKGSKRNCVVHEGEKSRKERWRKKNWAPLMVGLGPRCPREQNSLRLCFASLGRRCEDEGRRCDESTTGRRTIERRVRALASRNSPVSRTLKRESTRGG